MKPAISLISIALCITIYSCKKNKNGPGQNPDEFSFIYNGVIYNRSVNNNVADASVFSYMGNPAVFIDMPAVFGGRIYFTKAACAYLEPGNKVIKVTEPNCGLSTTDDYGNPAPIDSVEAYIYQSGTMNISFSNFETKTETDILTGQTGTYVVCRASGNFDLTLVNKDNQTIKITNGKVDLLIRK